MIILHTVEETRRYFDEQRAAGKTVGMCGTSGKMHAGHASLVAAAKDQNDVSVLVWTGGMSLSWATSSSPSYDVDMQQDLDLVAAHGLDVCYVPIVSDLYPQPSDTWITLESFAEAPGRLEDPLHLRVVATMVSTFLNILGPCRAYFGEKDWQQLAMMKKMVKDLHMPVEMLGCPIIRDADGVATSSRNHKLTPEHRAAAPVIYRALQATAEAAASGERNSAKLTAVFTDLVEPVAPVDYVKVLDSLSLAPLEEVDRPARMLVSVQFGDIRLVDNIGLDPA